MSDPTRPGSALAGIYLALGLALVGGFAFVAFRGIEPGSAPRQFVPEGVRKSPGGYRGHVFFWHSGYRGGK